MKNRMESMVKKFLEVCVLILEIYDGIQLQKLIFIDTMSVNDTNKLIMFNWLPPCDIIWWHGTWSSLVHIMAWHQVGDKPLLDPLLTYYQSDPLEKKLWNLYQNAMIFIEQNLFENVICRKLAVCLGHHCMALKIQDLQFDNFIITGGTCKVPPVMRKLSNLWSFVFNVALWPLQVSENWVIIAFDTEVSLASIKT